MSICNKILVPVIALILLPQILVGHQDDAVPRIINGYPCDTTKLPFYVIIVTRSLCGGTLITYEWVLTAAHCVRPELLEGEIGKVYSASKLKQIRHIEETHMHPNFNVEEFRTGRDLRNDIGLIKLDKPFSHNSAIGVGTLPSPGFTKQCSEVMTAGIGMTYHTENLSRNSLLNRPLLCVNLTIVDRCQQSFPNSIFDENVFCAYEEGKDACKGDSGGPIICDNVIIGVVSFGPTPCAVGSAAGTYTKVEGFYDFINPIINSKLSIKHGPLNNTSGGDKRVNVTSGKKQARASNEAPALVTNWKLIFISFLYYFVL